MYTIVEHAQDLDGLRLNVPETCECWGGVARSSSGCFLGLKMAIPPKVSKSSSSINVQMRATGLWGIEFQTTPYNSQNLCFSYMNGWMSIHKLQLFLDLNKRVSVLRSIAVMVWHASGFLFTSSGFGSSGL